MPLKNYIFQKYLSGCFVETGTSFGGGVRLALESGYGRVFSIEKNAEAFKIASNELGQDARVDLLYGDSPEELSVILEVLFEPCTFWLDAHNIEIGECPILAELCAIAESRIKTHTIIIDDWEDFGTPKHGNIAKESVIDAIRQINPDYRIACHYGEVGAPNVLVASFDYAN